MIATEQLYNRVLKYIKSTGTGFTRDTVNSVGQRVVKTLRDTLWYIDKAHQQFVESAIHLPEFFREFQGFNDYKKNRKHRPRMTTEGLDRHHKHWEGF